MNADIKAAIHQIRSDQDSSARQLALLALQALRSVAKPSMDGEFREHARALALSRPMNTAIENAVALAWSGYLDTSDPIKAIDETIESIELTPDAIAASASKVMTSSTVMTHSYSSSVIELLKRMKPSRVIVSETRPFDEGVKVARKLVNAGISATLVTEAQVALFVQEADTVVVGAHTILPEGDFINKIGTRVLALAAKDAGVPFYAVSDTFKVAAPSEPLPFAPEEGKATEICDEKWLQVRNVYYEVTPSRLVTSYITEEGVLDPAEMERYAGAAEKRWQSLMNSIAA